MRHSYVKKAYISFHKPKRDKLISLNKRNYIDTNTNNMNMELTPDAQQNPLQTSKHAQQHYNNNPKDIGNELFSNSNSLNNDHNNNNIN